MMRGVQRTMAVFDCFTPQTMSLTLQEIADTLGLPKSTTFRIVQSLEKIGYLIRLEDQKYCLSFRFTRLAGMVMSTLSIRQVARPVMLALAQQTNETITLNVASGRDRTCIDVIDTPSPLMSLARPGQHVLLDHRGATAKTIMAHLPKADMERRITQAAKALGRRRSELLAELAQVRKDGCCISHGERVLGLSAMAAPIWESDGTVNYCIAITAPTVRMKPRVDEFRKHLLRTTRDISRRLGVTDAPVAVPRRNTRARKSTSVASTLP
jgi:DNA-binding IclR family transcriptional regulator